MMQEPDLLSVLLAVGGVLVSMVCLAGLLGVMAWWLAHRSKQRNIDQAVGWQAAAEAMGLALRQVRQKHVLEGAYRGRPLRVEESAGAPGTYNWYTQVLVAVAFPAGTDLTVVRNAGLWNPGMPSGDAEVERSYRFKEGRPEMAIALVGSPATRQLLLQAKILALTITPQQVSVLVREMVSDPARLRLLADLANEAADTTERAVKAF